MIVSGPEESSTHSTSMPSETPISLEEDENLLRNTSEEVQCSKKKQKKGKKEQTQEEMSKIMNAIENFEGPSVKECMKILKKLTTYEDPLYYVANLQLMHFARRKSIEWCGWKWKVTKSEWDGFKA